MITARAQVLSVREDKPGTAPATTIPNRTGTVGLDGTPVLWRDPVVDAAARQAWAGTGEGGPA